MVTEGSVTETVVGFVVAGTVATVPKVGTLAAAAACGT